MPRQHEHQIASAFLAILAEAVIASTRGQPVTGERLLAAGAGGFFGGLAPDLLEPATHPNHRSVAHSLAAGGGIAYAAVQSQGTDLSAAFLRGLGVGYVGHLAMDAGTPRGAPLLGRGF